MPAAASSTGRPSFTKAKAKISTQATAKNSVVVTTSQLFASIATSFRSTSHTVRRNISAGPDERAVAGAQAGRRRLVGEQAAVAHQRDAGGEAVGQIEIVRRHDDDRAVRGQPPQASRDQADRPVVETGERLIKKHQARTMQQRALEREALPHAAREAADRVV